LKINNTKILVFLQNSFIWLLNLILLYAIKYRNQNLSITEFKFTLGNVINLSCVLFNIILLAVVLIKNNFSKIKITQIYGLTFGIFISLFVVFILTEFNIPIPKIYIGYYHIKKILILVAFMFVQILQFYISSILLGSLQRRTPKILEHLLFITIFFSILYVISFANLFSKVSFNENKKYDYGVVLGAAVWSNNRPSPSLIERVERAITLFKSGNIEKIYLTGGNAPGELSEAEVAFNYIQKKYPEKDILDNIILEKETKSTAEQIYYVKLLLKQNKNILIISDYLHVLRAQKMCEFFNVKADVAPTNDLSESKITIFKLFREASALLMFLLFAY